MHFGAPRSWLSYSWLQPQQLREVKIETLCLKKWHGQLAEKCGTWTIFVRERDRMHENIKTFAHIFKNTQKIDQRPIQVVSLQGERRNGAADRDEGKFDSDTWLGIRPAYFPRKCGLNPFIVFCFAQQLKKRAGNRQTTENVVRVKLGDSMNENIHVFARLHINICIHLRCPSVAVLPFLSLRWQQLNNLTSHMVPRLSQS